MLSTFGMKILPIPRGLKARDLKTSTHLRLRSIFGGGSGNCTPTVSYYLMHKNPRVEHVTALLD